ncbi:MAG: SUMF1/EgtB/PvdO family nonheme iron enzyme [Pseudomonadota bacterium]
MTLYKTARAHLVRHAIVACAILCALVAQPARAERRVALIIGNSAYDQGALKNPVNDARDMRARLQQLGFAAGDIVYRENLKAREIGATLREFRGKLGAGDVALVFYAGHGVQFKGENFLTTVDAQIEGVDDLPSNSLSLSALMDVLAESNSRVKLVFLDACRNNPYKSFSRSGSRGLARAGPETPAGTLIAYATRANDVAADGNGNNGVFTRALLAHMGVPGQPIEQMFKKVIRSVRDETDGKQAPWQEGALEGDFYFVPAAAAPSAAPLARGTVFADCAACPEMVVVPAGSVMIGSPESEAGRSPSESQHLVTIAKQFAVGKYTVTFEQWDACLADGGCGAHRPADEGWGRARRPVVNVSWNDAQLYVKWLSAKTGQRYRLLYGAEWEYAARAGTTTARHWGAEIGKGMANCVGCGSQWEGTQTAPVGSFAPNQFGLYDMLGNVWQLTEDCYDERDGATIDGSVPRGGECGEDRLVRGGEWGQPAQHARAAGRIAAIASWRIRSIGFRVARALP